MVICSAMAKLHLFLHIPLIILEVDLSILCNCSMNGIYIIVNRFVHGLNPSRNENLTLQCRCFIFARQFFQLCDQLIGLSGSDELGRLNHIHQKLQFRDLKRTLHHMITISASARLSCHFDSKDLQIAQIIVETLSLCRNLITRQFFLDLCHGQKMIFIRLFQHNLCQPVQLKFLILSFRHISSSCHLYVPV